MIRYLKAHFDGAVIVPDEPVRLPVGKPLRIQVTVPSRRKKPIIGLGKFRSGVPDLASNKKHLKGFGG